MGPGDVFGMLFFFSAIVIIVRIIKGVKERGYAHKERMRALELGRVDTFPPLEVEPERRPPRSTNLGLHGVIWTGIGGGLLFSAFVMGLFVSDRDADEALAFLLIWAFPALFVGLGLLYLSRRAEEREREEKANGTASPPRVAYPATPTPPTPAPAPAAAQEPAPPTPPPPPPPAE